jgi:hypothetical protein
LIREYAIFIMVDTSSSRFHIGDSPLCPYKKNDSISVI